jgi:hypothetical protein
MKEKSFITLAPGRRPEASAAESGQTGATASSGTDLNKRSFVVNDASAQ